MIEIAVIIALVMAIGKWLKTSPWFPNSAIPAAIVIFAIIFNVINAFLFGDGDMLEAGKMAFLEAIIAIGIHSATKNMIERKS